MNFTTEFYEGLRKCTKMKESFPLKENVVSVLKPKRGVLFA